MIYEWGRSLSYWHWIYSLNSILLLSNTQASLIRWVFLKADSHNHILTIPRIWRDLHFKLLLICAHIVLLALSNILIFHLCLIVTFRHKVLLFLNVKMQLPNLASFLFLCTDYTTTVIWKLLGQLILALMIWQFVVRSLIGKTRCSFQSCWHIIVGVFVHQ